MTLNKQETAQVLHALRIVQMGGRIQGCAAGDCEHFDETPAMTNEEIDALCEKINCEGEDPALSLLQRLVDDFPEFNDPDAPLAGSEAVDRIYNLWEAAKDVIPALDESAKVKP